MSATSYAGANGSDITGGSSSFALSFKSEENSEIGVTDAKEPIDFKIPRSAGFKFPEYELVNSSNMTISPSDPFYPFGIQVTQPMSGVFVHLKPDDLELGYFIWIGLGSVPFYDEAKKNFSDARTFCPGRDLKHGIGNETFYQYFSNINRTANFTGFMGVGVREMTNEELISHCLKNETIPSAFESELNFTSDFGWRGFTANCFHFDEAIDDWVSNGVELLEDTNHEYTHWYV